MPTASDHKQCLFVLLSYPSVAHWWFPRETSRDCSHSATYPAGCPAPASPSASRPPSWSWSSRPTCGPWSPAEEAEERKGAAVGWLDAQCKDTPIWSLCRHFSLNCLFKNGIRRNFKSSLNNNYSLTINLFTHYYILLVKASNYVFLSATV